MWAVWCSWVYNHITQAQHYVAVGMATAVNTPTYINTVVSQPMKFHTTEIRGLELCIRSIIREFTSDHLLYTKTNNFLFLLNLQTRYQKCLGVHLESTRSTPRKMAHLNTIKLHVKMATGKFQPILRNGFWNWNLNFKKFHFNLNMFNHIFNIFKQTLILTCG